MNANVNVLSDRALLNNYLSGDRSAISELIERHSQRVRNYIGMMVKDNDIADDIFQETFIKAVKVIDEGRYVDSGKFLSWVLRIAHNRVLDYFRREKASKQINESEAGYDMIGTMRFSEPTAEDNMVLGEVVWSTKENLEKRMMAEAGACDDKLRIAKRAKAMDWDAIHDTVHEMAKDEARHGKGFEGLYNRYFKK